MLTYRDLLKAEYSRIVWLHLKRIKRHALDLTGKAIVGITKSWISLQRILIFFSNEIFSHFKIGVIDVNVLHPEFERLSGSPSVDFFQ